MVCRPFATPSERAETSEVGDLNNACSLSTLQLRRRQLSNYAHGFSSSRPGTLPGDELPKNVFAHRLRKFLPFSSPLIKLTFEGILPHVCLAEYVKAHQPKPKFWSVKNTSRFLPRCRNTSWTSAQRPDGETLSCVRLYKDRHSHICWINFVSSIYKITRWCLARVIAT